MDERTRNLRRWLTTGIVTLLAVAAYVASYRVTQIDLGRLFTSLPKSQKLLRDFFTPDIFTRKTVTSNLDLIFPVPCGSAAAPPPATSGPRLFASVPCANVKDIVTLEGENLAPRADVKIKWLLPNGQALFSTLTQTDENGHFSARVEVRPITAAADGRPSHLQAETSFPVGGPIPSQTLKDVTDAGMVTIFMALLATTAATIAAGPLSFLAASNIMRRSRMGTTIYFLVRSLFNLTRSYEPLVLATVLALWIGFGAFAGVLALTIVTVASLGKLFSEAVENIDPGPLEAVAATGANPLQVVLYAVVPQIIPDFISFIIYHWDINVRISTILGFVGGGGIGYYLSLRISALEYNKAGTALWAVVAVVWAMDFLSAEVRKRYT
ncbi:MAG: phosphonate ABC transporter, permease protein PhnE [Chloroflexi bacterium]|nr:phosphonate ABC transporter, permease protein PhnE [Chloroflexota bacterium]